MSDYRHAFEVLVQALSGHFVPSKQTKVQKRELLELLFKQPGGGFDSFNALVDAYHQQHSDLDRSRLERSLRRALKLISAWIERYYREFPDQIIRFELVECRQLRIRLIDGFEGRSIQSIVDEIADLIGLVDAAAKRVRLHFDGTHPCSANGNFTECVTELAALSARLQRAQSALRMRV